MPTASTAKRPRMNHPPLLSGSAERIACHATTPAPRLSNRQCGLARGRVNAQGPRGAEPRGQTARLRPLFARPSEHGSALTRRRDSATRPPRRRWVALEMAAIVAVSVVIVGVASDGLPSTLTPSVALGAPRFVDETASAGVDQVYAGGFEYAVGGGVAVFDCNGDGKPDLYLSGGSDAASLYRNDSLIGGAFRFTRLRDPATDLGAVDGAYPIDIDGDGVTDLVVLRNGENVLLRGLGGCRFERANERWGFNLPASATTAFSATWEAAATLPTLAFGSYVNPASDDPHHLCFDNVLLRPATTGAAFGRPVPLTPS